MSRNKIILGTLCIAAMGLVSCDDIPESDRLISVVPTDVKRVVLIQEFTGMRCQNCPDGARAVHALQEAYPGAIVAVNLHPENSSLTRPMDGLNLRCPEATEYYNYYNPQGLPAAVIDGGSVLTTIASWSTAAINAMGTPSGAEMNLDCSYDASSRTLTANWSLIFTQAFSGNANVQLWVMENDIHGRQIDHGRPVDYVHNHVLRGSLNGTWGENIGRGFNIGATASGSGSIVMKEEWVPENCQVVAFVYNSDSKAVAQTIMVNVAKKSDIPEEE